MHSHLPEHGQRAALEAARWKQNNESGRSLRLVPFMPPRCPAFEAGQEANPPPSQRQRLLDMGWGALLVEAFDGDLCVFWYAKWGTGCARVFKWDDYTGNF